MADRGAAGKADLVFYGTPAAASYQTCGQTGSATQTAGSGIF